ncbi:MAG: guanylate kinase [Pirellulaceae bacterium]|jgi:guanylate kinase
MTTEKGKLIILSGPSGSGKGTIVERLLQQEDLPIRVSISATTRAPRPQEQDGVNYYFLSHDEFQRRLAAGELLECKEVFGQKDWYGTLRDEVTSGFKDGKWVLLEIDVEGALSVLEHHPNALTIFVDPGSMEELENRLRKRQTESEESIRRRLEVALRELKQIDLYRHVIINDDVERAVQEIRDILTNSGEENA